MKKSLGFTLAEVLITLAIIGVVAAMTIPSVIVNTNQAEYRTGLRKAVAALNQAITMNIALEGESPADNSNLYEYLQQHMSIMSKVTAGDTDKKEFTPNSVFYTADGLRFEFPTTVTGTTINFHEKTGAKVNSNGTAGVSPGKCGSNGTGIFSENQDKDPCLIVVDVNGDKKPTPAAVNSSGSYDAYTYAKPGDRLLKDVFPIMVTDQKAVPFGTVGQKAMYQTNN